MLTLLFSVLVLFITQEASTSLEDCDQLFDVVANNELPPDAPPAQMEAYLVHLQKVLACYGEHLPNRKVYSHQTTYLFRLKRYDEALQTIDAFFDSFGESPDRFWFDHMYLWRGYIYRELGNYAAAAENYMQALENSEDRDLEYRANISLDSGRLFHMLRDFESATYYYQVANQLIEEADTSTGALRELQSLSLRLQADLRLEAITGVPEVDPASLVEIIDVLQRSLALAEAEDFFNSAGNTHVLLGETYSLLGEYASARRHLEEALRIAQRLDDAALLSLVYAKTGRLYLQEGALEAAERSFLDGYTQAKVASHYRFQRRNLYNLGLLYERMEAPDRALEAYQQSVAVAESLQATLRATDWFVRSFDLTQGAHRSTVRALLAQQRVEEAFLALEATRARFFQDLQHQNQFLQHVSPNVLARFDSLTAELIKARNELAREDLTADQRLEIENRENYLMGVRRALVPVEAPVRGPSVEALQEVLAERGQVLLSYFLDGRSTFEQLIDRPLRSYVFVLTPDTLAAVPLEVSSSSIRARLAAVSPVLTSPTGAVQVEADLFFSTDGLHQLYEDLVEPVAGLLPEGVRLAIIPDRHLYRLPFGMLLEEEPAERSYEDTAFLIRRHPITVETAAALLLRPPQAELLSTSDVVAFGKSDYSEYRDVFETVSGGRLSDRTSYYDLPSVEREMEMIAGRFAHARLYVNDAAREGAFFELEETPKILHIAAHTLIGASSPLHNAILLSGAGDEDDGKIYLHELQRRHLNAQFVVLSGCSTVQGRLYNGEGFSGLQYGFRAMGIPSALSTLWYVEDTAQQELMDAFYRYLQAGLPKDRALQQAQLAYLERAGVQRASPFYWASLVFYGDPSSLELARVPLLRRMAKSWGFWLMLFIIASFFVLYVFWNAAGLRRSFSRAL